MYNNIPVQTVALSYHQHKDASQQLTPATIDVAVSDEVSVQGTYQYFSYSKIYVIIHVTISINSSIITHVWKEPDPRSYEGKRRST